jgi:predicted Zn-dependent protease with MMP-like domain
MESYERMQNADGSDHNRETTASGEEYEQDSEQVQDIEGDEYEQDQTENEDEYDYDREPPLDSTTVSSNRQRSKYVFMTLCFLLALILFYTYVMNMRTGNTGDWFPLTGAIILGIMGVVFLRSPDSPAGTPSSTEGEPEVAEEDAPVKLEKVLSPFEELVQEALATIPEAFQQKMENVMVQVQYEPDEETLTRVGAKEGSILLGLYEGVPLTIYGREYAPYPETITIFQRSIEDYCRHDPVRIREQVRSTVLHEVAHHFGMGHDAMPIWVK